MDRKEALKYQVFCGVDVGKATNYVVALGRDDDERLVSRAVEQTETDMRAALAEATSHGVTLLVVDQPGSFGRLTVAVARDMGIDVAQIPPKRFRQVAETYGEGKSDAKDAFIIADAARSTPRNVELLGSRGDAIAAIRVVTSCRDDVVHERTRTYNRLHDLINQVCPPLERLFSGQKLHSELATRIFARYGGPHGLRRAGRSRASKWAGSLKWHRNDGPAKIAEVFDAIDGQTVDMPGTDAIERQIMRLAARALELETEERSLNGELERLSSLVPEVSLLRSVPGIGAVYGATIAAEIGDVSRFSRPSSLASYAGVAPVREESGSSVSRSRRRKGGNRRLKNAVIRSSECSVLHDEVARGYYDRKRAEGKSHRQAIRSLARRRIDLVYALLRDGTLYEPSSGRV